MADDLRERMRDALKSEGAEVESATTTARRPPGKAEADRAKIARWYVTGIAQNEMARRLDISHTTVASDVEVIREEWRRSARLDWNEYTAVQLARIDALEQTYWEAWYRSMEEREETIKEARQTPRGMIQGGRTKIVRPIGDKDFLSGVQWCIAERNKMLGLYAPSKLAPTTPGGDKPYDPVSDETRAALLVAEFIRARNGNNDQSNRDAGGTERIRATLVSGEPAAE